MLRQFFCANSLRLRAFAWLGLLVFIGHQFFRAYLKYAVNEFYGRFYDLLQQSVEYSSGTVDDEWRAAQRTRIFGQLLEFAQIVAPAVVIHPVAGYVRNRWVLAWRLCLIESYVALWDTALPPIEGASQRVHEDTQRFASGIHSCVASLVDALLTLAIFCPLLWSLDPPLMGVAIATAVSGVGVSAFVGRHLVDLEVGNQKAEAALRRGLVVLEVEPGSLLPDTESGGQAMGPVAVPPERVDATFVPLINVLYKNYKKLYSNFAGLQLWLSTYDQFATILPYLMVAPRLFAANEADVLTLGTLTQSANAFGLCFGALSIVSENWLSVNEFRSVLRRLREYEAAILSRRSPPSAQLVPNGTELSDAPPVEPPMQPTQEDDAAQH